VCSRLRQRNWHWDSQVTSARKPHEGEVWDREGGVEFGRIENWKSHSHLKSRTKSDIKKAERQGTYGAPLSNGPRELQNQPEDCKKAGERLGHQQGDQGQGVEGGVKTGAENQRKSVFCTVGKRVKRAFVNLKKRAEKWGGLGGGKHEGRTKFHEQSQKDQPARGHEGVLEERGGKGV